MKKIILYIAVVFITGIFSCTPKNDWPDTPTLKFLALNKSSFHQGFAKEDSLEIWLEVIDGDGDIGFEKDDTLNKSILIKDLRTGNITEQFKIPFIPENIVVNGLQAEIQLKLYSTCCLFPDNIPPCNTIELYPYDTIQYEIHIIDRAGNVSNKVQTPLIQIICD